jgi:hypothetical protein
MYCESGMFPLFAADTTTPTSTNPGPVANGGETPPPPDDPPKV